MKITRFSVVYNSFLSKITDDELDSWKNTYKGIIIVDISFDVKRMKQLYKDFVQIIQQLQIFVPRKKVEVLFQVRAFFIAVHKNTKSLKVRFS